MEPLTLQGKTVIITRPPQQAEEFSQRLRDRGAGVIFFPTIEIVPPRKWDEVDEAIEHNRAYDAFVFTSTNAVRYFFDRARQRGMGPESLMRKTIYAIGSKTAEAAAFYGVAAVRLPGVTNAREFADALLASGVKHRRVLIPKGRLASSVIADALRVMHDPVDEVIVYDTVVPGSDETTGGGRSKSAGTREGVIAEIKAIIDAGKADVVTFFSPSSVENFFFLLPECTLQGSIVAAIGETTAAALRSLKIRVDVVPEHPNVEEFAEAIEHFF